MLPDMWYLPRDIARLAQAVANSNQGPVNSSTTSTSRQFPIWDFYSLYANLVLSACFTTRASLALEYSITDNVTISILVSNSKAKRFNNALILL